jgi:Sugar phosphate isomerases/epimerases
MNKHHPNCAAGANRVSRRRFLSAAATTVAGAALSGARSGAVEQIKRPSPARLKVGLAAYSYRDYLQDKLQPHMTYEEFIDRSAGYPIDGLELTEYYFPKPVTREYLMRMKRQCFLAGLDVAGSAIGNVFTHPAGLERDKEIGRVKEWIDWCDTLGAPVIRIFAGERQKDQSVEDARRNAIESIEIACEYAGQKGIMLAMENHGGIVSDAEGVLAIVKAVKSPWFGLKFDSGNFRTDDPYADLVKIAPYAVTTHIKTEIQPRGKAKQPADLKRTMQILKDAGYRGYVTLEYEATEEPLKAVPRILEQMATLL